MTDRDRLLELLHKAPKGRGRISNYELANYLLANGVIVPPVEEGQTVYYKEFHHLLKKIPRTSVLKNEIDNLLNELVGDEK